jgi:hypothetical protein
MKTESSSSAALAFIALAFCCFLRSSLPFKFENPSYFLSWIGPEADWSIPYSLPAYWTPPLLLRSTNHPTTVKNLCPDCPTQEVQLHNQLEGGYLHLL